MLISRKSITPDLELEQRPHARMVKEVQSVANSVVLESLH